MANKMRTLIQNCPDYAAPQTAPGVWETALDLLEQRGGRVLVAGAGRGGLSWILAEAGYAVTSIDLHPEHFKVPALNCTFCDLNQPLPFAADNFDLVLAIEVVEHLENPWAFLREAIRVLKPGGNLVFSTPNVESLASRLCFLTSGSLPYFKEDSFVGCYHVTPIFSWAVERCCRTTQAKIIDTRYSRFDWPRNNDIPRYDGNKGLRRAFLDLFPVNKLSGEIACYKLGKTDSAPSMSIGAHYS